jgi:DNA repair exonuclease SbcCD nuclease subunit
VSGGTDDQGARLLFVGDVHLGRRPGGLPAALDAHGLTADELAPAAAWRGVVDYALEHRVDAVVLAGDVVESENARFEAFGPLDREVRRLVDAGVAVVAVSGNHDGGALPRLADAMPDFRLLGRDGRWEQLTLRRGDRPLAHLLGWSFPGEQVETSPLAGVVLPPDPDDALPRIGLLHCDLDTSGSPYAPVARAELERAPVDGWLLGHVHVPSDLSGDRPIGYLGSLVGLDPTETGLHGPWLVTAAERGGLAARQLPLAPLRWEALEVAVDELSAPEQLLAAVGRALETLGREIAAGSGDATRAIGCRVTLTGTTPIHRELREALRRTPVADYARTVEGRLCFVNRIADRSRPRIDLPRIAGDETPPALLARHLLRLQRGEAEATELIRKARARLKAEDDDPRWSQLERCAFDDDEVRRLLVDAGMRALEELLAQGAAGEEGGA